MIPGFMFAFGSFQPAPWMSRSPVLGQHLLIADIVRGHAPDPATAAALTMVTLVWSGAALWAVSALLSRERIVRRLSA
jgi:hypothetical protein